MTASPRSGIVTVVTDFGTVDGYVGAVKGAVLAAAPFARVVDVTHDVGPQQIHEAAFALLVAAPLFPRGTVHLAVVDPGVGSSRRAVAIALGGGEAFLVGPDNGIFSYLLDDARSFECVSIDPSGFHGASPTFHGRDLFGPVAGRIAAGEDPAAFGKAVSDPVRLTPYREPIGARAGRVLHVDRFGNIVTSLRPVGTGFVVSVAGEIVRRRVLCYVELPAGELGWYVGSLGLIEMGIRNGSAAGRLGVPVGTAVELLPQ